MRLKVIYDYSEANIITVQQIKDIFFTKYRSIWEGIKIWQEGSEYTAVKERKRLGRKNIALQNNTIWDKT